MFATFETRSPADLATDPALVEAFTLHRLGDDRATTLALWTETADPSAFAVETELRGQAADRPAGAAVTLWFDAPMSPARLAAARFSFRERVAPALATVPGHVRSLVLFRERDAASCVVGLAVDLPALDAGGTAVNSTALLPGEDPALLTGPDRVETHHVTPSTEATR